MACPSLVSAVDDNDNDDIDDDGGNDNDDSDDETNRAVDNWPTHHLPLLPWRTRHCPGLLTIFMMIVVMIMIMNKMTDLNDD